MKSSRRILAVDDDPMNLSIVQDILEDDYEVRTAESGEKALEIAPSFRPDLILLDIVMPGLNGYETCRRLRTNSELKYSKIILVSAKAMVTERLKGYEAGADDYLTKPFDHEEFLAKVNVFVRLSFMEEMDQLKNEFLSLLSHETRTPLTQITAPAEFLLTGEEMTWEQRRDLAQIILKGTGRLHALFDQIAFLLSFKRNDLATEAEDLDLSALLHQVYQSREERILSHELTLDIQSPPGLPICSDRRRLRLALEALLDNQIETSPRGGTVRWELSHDRERIFLKSSDQRVIDSKARDHLFDFFRVADVAHHGGEICLELPLVREIVRYLGGEVSITGQDQETSLSIQLPRDLSSAA